MKILAIEAAGLEKTYPGDVRALDGLDLAVPAGTIFALLGPNGAGKSTTVRILTTLSRADSGRARVAGHARVPAGAGGPGRRAGRGPRRGPGVRRVAAGDRLRRPAVRGGPRGDGAREPDPPG